MDAGFASASGGVRRLPAQAQRVLSGGRDPGHSRPPHGVGQVRGRRLPVAFRECVSTRYLLVNHLIVSMVKGLYTPPRRSVLVPQTASSGADLPVRVVRSIAQVLQTPF